MRQDALPCRHEPSCGIQQLDQRGDEHGVAATQIPASVITPSSTLYTSSICASSNVVSLDPWLQSYKDHFTT